MYPPWTRYRAQGCSVFTSRIGGEWVSALFMMFSDGKEGGEWYLMKDCNAIVKKS